MGQGPAAQIIGVGRAAKIDKLRIRWPNGDWQEFDDLPANSDIELCEGQSKAVVAP